MASDVITAYIGLGSNLEDPIHQVKSAIAELGRLPESGFIAASSLYRSVPLGPQDQPDFINAVVALGTTLAPYSLLDELQALEEFHQRKRERHWGPRTLDLDLLLYGNEVIDTERLTVPHPGVSIRNFVLIPLFEIAPDLRLPDNQALSDLIQRCSKDGLQRLEEN